jgi:hypothetical protein
MKGTQHLALISRSQTSLDSRRVAPLLPHSSTRYVYMAFTCVSRTEKLHHFLLFYDHLPPLDSSLLTPATSSLFVYNPSRPTMSTIRPRSPQSKLLSTTQRIQATQSSSSGAGDDDSIEQGPPGRTSLELDTSPLLPSSPSQRQQTATIDHNEPIDWVMTSILFLFPALGGALFGYDIGASSGALLSMTSPTLSGTDWYDLTAFQSGLVVSLSLAGALLGSAGALVYGDRLGRRRELLMAAGLYTIGSLGVGVAGSLDAVLIGRLMYGLGIGFAMHAAPAYVGFNIHGYLFYI